MNKIRELRNKRKLTQEELANKIGITRTSIVFWEQGKSLPSSRYLTKLSKALRCKVTDLL